MNSDLSPNSRRPPVLFPEIVAWESFALPLPTQISILPPHLSNQTFSRHLTDVTRTCRSAPVQISSPSSASSPLPLQSPTEIAAKEEACVSIRSNRMGCSTGRHECKITFAIAVDDQQKISTRHHIIRPNFLLFVDLCRNILKFWSLF